MAAVLCCAVPCRAVLSCAALRCAALRCDVMCNDGAASMEVCVLMRRRAVQCSCSDVCYREGRELPGIYLPQAFWHYVWDQACRLDHQTDDPDHMGPAGQPAMPACWCTLIAVGHVCVLRLFACAHAMRRDHMDRHWLCSGVRGAD